MNRLSKIVTSLMLILGAGLVLLPLGIVLLTSFAPAAASLDSVFAIDSFTWENYREAWSRGHFLLAFANSTIVAVGVTALQIFTSALAGYALARIKFPGRETILLIIIATLVIPFQLLVIPIFVVLKWGHLINAQ